MTMAKELFEHDELVSQILSSSAPFADAAEEATCRRMVEELDAKEQEHAARTSYAYFVSSTSETKDDPDDDDEETRARMAMREARRHLVGESGDYDTALANLKSTCQFRNDSQIDALRTCFWNDVESDTDKTATNFQSLLKKDLETQLMGIRGHDREHRAVLLKMGRVSNEIDASAYALAQIYMVERANACTEALSKGTQEEIVVIFDFGDYSSANSPPLAVVRRTVKTLQQFYPERLKRLMILDAPLWMRGVYNIVYPFLSSRTQSKIIMVSGAANKEASVSSLLDESQAMPFMLADGKLTTEIQIQRMLHEVPFHSLYDGI